MNNKGSSSHFYTYFGWQSIDSWFYATNGIGKFGLGFISFIFPLFSYFELIFEFYSLLFDFWGILGPFGGFLVFLRKFNYFEEKKIDFGLFRDHLKVF